MKKIILVSLLLVCILTAVIYKGDVYISKAFKQMGYDDGYKVGCDTGFARGRTYYSQKYDSLLGVKDSLANVLRVIQSPAKKHTHKNVLKQDTVKVNFTMDEIKAIEARNQSRNLVKEE